VHLDDLGVALGTRLPSSHVTVAVSGRRQWPAGPRSGRLPSTPDRLQL